MKGKLKYILALLVLGLVVAVMAWKFAFRKSETSVASEKPDVSISASDLLAAFEQDEAAANVQYLDKILLVTGTVESVTPDTAGITVYLKESDAVSGVICSFDKVSIDPSEISAGMHATIKGVCTGYLMDVVLNKCSLESAVK